MVGIDLLPNGSLASGNSVKISLVEAGGVAPVKYYPDTAAPDFQADTDPLLSAVTFIDKSGLASNGISGHATNTVGSPFFGNQGSISAGANEVSVYEAGNYLSDVLRATGGSAPTVQDFRVQNHSWIGTYDATPGDPPNSSELANDVSALRRFDFPDQSR